MIPPKALVLVCTLSALPVAASAQDITAGERLFDQRCASCHAIVAGENRTGPSLAGVVGRMAGSVEGARYSRNMQALGITWDEAALAEFLSKPRAMVRGTSMSVAIRDAGQQSDIIAFLATLSDPTAAEAEAEATN